MGGWEVFRLDVDHEHLEAVDLTEVVVAAEVDYKGKGDNGVY